MHFGQPTPHRIGLDLLRGAAAYMVVIGHCAPALLVLFGETAAALAGFPTLVGVELFFALSGFLIGGILLDIRITPGNAGRFLVRRWMRTLPVYYLALLVYLAFPATFEPEPAAQPWRYFVFLQNVTEHPEFFGVSWSLTIEEWFYIALPLLLLMRLRYLHAIALLIVAGIALRLLLDVNTRSSLLGRVDAIAYGCLLAWALRQAWSAPLERHARTIALGAMLGLVLVFQYFWTRRTAFTPMDGAFVFTALPALAALVIPWFITMQLRSPALAWIATAGAAVSYPLYVFHKEIIHALSRTDLHPGTGWLHIVAVLVIATAVAWLVHIAVERPLMRLRPALRRVVPGAGLEPARPVKVGGF